MLSGWNRSRSRLGMASDSGSASSVARARERLDLSHRFDPTDIPDDRPDRLAPRQSLHQAPDARLRLVLGGESKLGLARRKQQRGSFVDHRPVAVLDGYRISLAE